MNLFSFLISWETISGSIRGLFRGVGHFLFHLSMNGRFYWFSWRDISNLALARGQMWHFACHVIYIDFYVKLNTQASSKRRVCVIHSARCYARFWNCSACWCHWLLTIHARKTPRNFGRTLGYVNTGGYNIDTWAEQRRYSTDSS
jgi:hypothetical protein